MSFPLYDVLIKDISNKELTRDEKLKLLSMISSLDHKGHVNMYTLIRVHGLKTHVGENIFEIPYCGVQEKNNLKFNIDKLPNIVAQLIYKFATIHMQTMVDERIE